MISAFFSSCSHLDVFCYHPRSAVELGIQISLCSVKGAMVHTIVTVSSLPIRCVDSLFLHCDYVQC